MSPLEIIPMIVALLVVGTIVLVPVAGLTARFAIKPLIEQVMHLKDGDRQGAELRSLIGRVGKLEQQLAQRDERIEQLEHLVLGLPPLEEPRLIDAGEPRA